MIFSFQNFPLGDSKLLVLLLKPQPDLTLTDLHLIEGVKLRNYELFALSNTKFPKQNTTKTKAKKKKKTLNV